MSENLFDLGIGKLGFGFMRLPRLGDGFDTEQISSMVDLFLKNGYTYFDTAYIYSGSEEAMRTSLVERHPRESFQIATKLNLHGVESHDQLGDIFNTSCKRLGVTYVDFYLLHGLGARTGTQADDLGAWDFIAGLKAEGRARHIGFSFHGTPEQLEDILTKHPEAEFVQLQINYLDWDDGEVQSKRVYEIARAHNVPIIIMEPLKGGMLVGENSPIAKIFKGANPGASLASWAMRFAATLDGVLVTLSGMSALWQLEDTLATMRELKPLSAEETDYVQEAVRCFRAVPRVPCTQCRYCVDNCPQKIQIPTMMDLYSDYLVYQTTANTDHVYRLFAGPPASSCIACKVCEEQCPQHIGISDILAKMSKLFD